MATGTFYGDADNKYIDIRMVWTSKADKANNRSKVTVKLALRKSSQSTVATSGTAYARLKYGGKTTSYSAHLTIPTDGVWRTFKTWDLGYINHGADGTKKLYLGLAHSGNYSGINAGSRDKWTIGETITLPKITPPAQAVGTYRITSTASDGGEINPSGVRDKNSGSNQTYTMTPDSGFRIADVLVNNVSQGAIDSYSFSNITSNKTIHVEFEEIPPPPPIGYFTQEHQVKSTGILSNVKYRLQYVDGQIENAVVKLYRGQGTDGEPFYSGDHPVDTDIPLRGVEITEDEWITMRVEYRHELLSGLWNVDFFEAKGDNTWTHLGYADDKLVGMTANQQIWVGDVDSRILTNAKVLANPTSNNDKIKFTDLVKVGTGVSISADYHEENFPHRISICYTLVNKFGPTKPSQYTTFYASKPLVEWNTSNYIRIRGSAPNGAGVIAVELYYTDGDYQEPAFMGRVNTPEIPTPDEPAPNVKPWVFNWTGYQMDTTSWLVSNLSIPKENYTAGVPASKMSVIDGKLYFWGNPAHPYRIWMGGTPGNRFSVSPGTGGGFVDAEPGTGTVVSDVLKFKTQQGASIVTTVTDNVNSNREARFNLVESNISISSEQSVSGLMAEKVAGTVGCKSEHGAIAAGDGLYAVSRYGLAVTTLTMEYNSQLQVMYVSDPIEPVFLKLKGYQLKSSVLHEINGILYMTFGSGDGTLDNVIFCYDIGLKAWWTYTLEINEPILNMINIDYEGTQEGLGIILERGVYLLPTTQGSHPNVLPKHNVMIETGELSTVQPLQAVHHLTQLEFRFDYFIGEMEIIVKMVDQFGRVITTRKNVRHDEIKHQLAEHIRIDQVVESYSITMIGKANFRMTHFIANLYPKPARIGIVNGFNSSQTHGNSGLIRRTFNSYNELKNTIAP